MLTQKTATSQRAVQGGTTETTSAEDAEAVSDGEKEASEKEAEADAISAEEDDSKTATEDSAQKEDRMSTPRRKEPAQAQVFLGKSQEKQSDSKD